MRMHKAILTCCIILLLSGSIDAFLASKCLKRACRFQAPQMCENKPQKPTDGMMQRPILDNFITKAIYSLEMLRIKVMAEKPSEENDGWSGEPRAWANDDSLAQKVCPDREPISHFYLLPDHIYSDTISMPALGFEHLPSGPARPAEAVDRREHCGAV